MEYSKSDFCRSRPDEEESMKYAPLSKLRLSERRSIDKHLNIYKRRSWSVKLNSSELGGLEVISMGTNGLFEQERNVNLS